jgi:release factor glutamine methyltransferase
VETSARRLLRPGGLVVVEHGDDQAESAPACFAGWNDLSDHLDLARRPRYLTAVHP